MKIIKKIMNVVLAAVIIVGGVMGNFQSFKVFAETYYKESGYTDENGDKYVYKIPEYKVGNSIYEFVFEDNFCYSDEFGFVGWVDLLGIKGSVTEIIIPNEIPIEGYKNGVKMDDVFHAYVGYVANNFLSNNKEIKKVIQYYNCATIGDNSFSNCSNLESYIIYGPQGLYYVNGIFGEEVLLNCPKLTIYIDENVYLGDVYGVEKYAESNNIPFKIMSSKELTSMINSVNQDITQNKSNEKENIHKNESNQQEQEENMSTLVQYIYDEENKVDISTDGLNNILIVEDAEKAVEEMASELSYMDKRSADGIDKAILFSEEAIARAATLKTDSDEIIINDLNMAELADKATEVEEKVLKALSAGSVKRARKANVNAKIVTSNSGKVSISKEKLNKNIDNVKVETPYAGVSFSAKAVSNVSIENKGTNKIAVDFETNKTSEKIKISFPNMSGTGNYMAVVDENGNAIGGKYNPVTGELTAKINASGVYSVVNNEKNFSDIKNKAAEMQEAIKLLASKGIISGTSETEFSPDKSISRAEVAAIILRTLSKLDENADGNFSDVTKENWYYGTAGSAKNAGIINGYEDNTFRGNVVIPKVQIVSVYARVLKNEMNYYDVDDIEKVLGEYGDREDIAQWAESDIALATDVNMVLRRKDSLFGGNEEMTRGDAAIILKRLFDKIW